MALNPIGRIRVNVTGARGLSDYQLWQQNGNLGTYQDYLDYLADIVIANNPGFQGPQGNPGGNVMSVGLFQDIGGLTIANGADILRVSGYRARGIGVFDLVYDPTIDNAFVAAHPGWSKMSSNGRGYRIQRGPVELDWLGAIPDGANSNPTDNYAAWLVYLDLINFENINSGSQLGAARALHMFGEHYFFSDTLQFKRTIRLTGFGSGQAAAAQSILRWPVSKAGIIVNAPNTLGEGVQATPTRGGDGSIIEGFSIRGGEGPANELKSGVWFRGRGILRDCTTRGFAGHGFLVRASEASSDPTIIGNANGTIVENIRTENNIMSGGRAVGADANACEFRAIDSSNNGAWGWEEDSFLGNDWTGQSEGNGLGAWKSSGATNQSIITAYTENDQLGALKGGSVLARGRQYAGYQDGGGGAYISGEAAVDGGGVSSDKGWYAKRKRASDNMELRSRIGGEDSFMDVTIYTPQGAPYEQHKLTSDNAGNIGWSIGGAFAAYRITMRVKYGRASNVDAAFQVPRLFVGEGDDARQIGGASAMPSSGEYARGDFIRNISPDIIGGRIVLGWSRITTGTAHVLGTDWAACYAVTS